MIYIAQASTIESERTTAWEPVWDTLIKVSAFRI